MSKLRIVLGPLGALCCTVSLLACASSGPQTPAEPEPWMLETQEEVEALKRAVDASYERERVLAERLQRVEEDNVRLREEAQSLATQLGTVEGQIDSLPKATTAKATPVDIGRLYDEARVHYDNYQYEPALELFDRALQADPYGKLADNAQYWKGECYYGLARYSQALAEFTKVFAYPKTEKGDDAQLKIGHCYKAQGEISRARAAYQKLLDEFPDSEYVEKARRALQNL